jgi:hypothetical protein
VELLGFYEGAGVLVSRGLLHEDVSSDAPFALELVWPIIEAMQQTLDPAAWENVTWPPMREDTWWKTRWRAKL